MEFDVHYTVHFILVGKSTAYSQKFFSWKWSPVSDNRESNYDTLGIVLNSLFRLFNLILIILLWEYLFYRWGVRDSENLNNFLKCTTAKDQNWNLNLNLFYFRAKDLLIMHQCCLSNMLISSLRARKILKTLRSFYGGVSILCPTF